MATQDLNKSDLPFTMMGPTLLERIARLEERVTANAVLATQAYNASEKAISKAEFAQEKRLDSMNEFRGQIKDQNATNIARVEVMALIESIRNEFTATTKAMNEKLAEVTKRQDILQGAEKGISVVWVAITGAIAMISTIISIYSALKH